MSEKTLDEIFLDGFNETPSDETPEERIRLVREAGFTGLHQRRHRAGLEAVASHARKEALMEVLAHLEHAGTYELTWKDAKNFITSELSKPTA